jgi:hypothetical protein
MLANATEKWNQFISQFFGDFFVVFGLVEQTIPTTMRFNSGQNSLANVLKFG